MQCGAGGCNNNPIVIASGQTGPTGIAVDASNVYWTTGDGNVMTCAIGGCPGSPTPVATGQDSPVGVASDGVEAYWATGNGSVMACAVAGCNGNPTTFASGQNAPLAVAVDATNIYWVNNGDGTVMKCGKWRASRRGPGGLHRPSPSGNVTAMRGVMLSLLLGLAACSTNSGSLTPDASSDSASDAPRDAASSEAGACMLPDSSTPCQEVGFQCCNGACANEENDSLNCGGCGVRCSPPTSMCHGTCVIPTCAPTCDAGAQCCLVNTAGPAQPPACYPGASCPLGCPGCT
jgi:hypothetical protein